MDTKDQSVPAAAPLQSGVLAGPVELLSVAWKLFRENWKTLMPIVMVPLLATAIGRILSVADVSVLPVVGGFLVFIAGVFTIFMQIALTDSVRQISNGSAVALSTKAQYKVGLKLFWPFVWLVILQVLVFLGSSILFIIPAIVMGVYTSMYSLSLIIDGKRGWSAFTESYTLVRGRWWGTLGRLVSIGLVSAACYLVGVGLSFLLELLFGLPLKSSGAGALSAVVGDLIGIFVWPLAAIYTYKLYESLKASRLPNIETKTFRRWLITFLVIGILTPFLVLGIGLPILLSNMNDSSSSYEFPTMTVQP